MQAAHAPVGLELQTSEGEGQSGIDAIRHPSRRRRSLARGGLSRAIVISFWHPIDNGMGSFRRNNKRAMAL